MMSIAGTPVTFVQMRDRSCAAANVLLNLGVRRGETVALFSGTCPEWVYFWLGAARIGAVTAAVNAANKGEFLSHALRLSRAPDECGSGNHEAQRRHVTEERSPIRARMRIDQFGNRVRVAGIVKRHHRL